MADINVSEKISKNFTYDMILFSLIGIIFIWLIIITILFSEKKDSNYLLYMGIGVNDTIKATNTDTELYNYHTRNHSSELRSYQGKFLVTISPTGSVTFKVKDQTGKDITGDIIVPDYPDLPIEILFNTDTNASNLILHYTCNQDFVLHRIEIKIN